MPNPTQKEPARPFTQRWYGRLALVVLSVLLLTLALAPTYQFYLAWVGLVPWLWVVGKARSHWRAFLWSWLAGTLFFLANLWWLLYVTEPGMVALVIYLGLYWGVAAVIFRMLGWVKPTGGQSASPRFSMGAIFGIALMWTALEWLRGTLFTGLPWLYLGHTQSPILLICQIADLFGVYGVSFCVATLNALLYWHLTTDRRTLWPATGAVAALWICSAAYGLYRLEQMNSVCTPGPVVLIVQSNYPQDNSGKKGAEEPERVAFHLRATRDAIAAAEKPTSRLGGVDLVCWSETEMPELNPEFRDALRPWIPLVRDPDGLQKYIAFLDDTVRSISQLASGSHANILTGGIFSRDLDETTGRPRDSRNTAYLFRSDGKLAAEHSDKIHLVPFGEFIPFRGSHWFGWLHDIFQNFSPYSYDYTLTRGSEDSPTVLAIPTAKSAGPTRLVAPICFEDLDAPLVARMFRGAGQKRADLIVNLTNDGWFRANENTQHLQAAIFRSIENRVPTARSVNTGISAFVDSYGRELQRVPVRTEGTLTGHVRLDSRYTLYTRLGDWFPILCTLSSAGILLIAWRLNRKTKAS